MSHPNRRRTDKVRWGSKYEEDDIEMIMGTHYYDDLPALRRCPMHNGTLCSARRTLRRASLSQFTAASLNISRSPDCPANTNCNRRRHCRRPAAA
jgi:hypothetical protein